MIDLVAIERRTENHRVIAADDMVFIDLGPVFGGWEADVARSYAVGDDPLWQGVRASLQVGVSYNRMLLEAMERFLDAQAATGSS